MIRPIDGHLSLTDVETTDHHISALFEFLKQRHDGHRISHEAVPSFEAHREFVLSHTYRYWFLVSFDADFIGTVYLTSSNVLGAFFDDAYLRHLGPVILFVTRTFEPLPAVPSSRNSAFTINLSPNNTAYAAIVEELGGRMIQQSYILPHPHSDAGKDAP
jgi:hypothetical protein